MANKLLRDVSVLAASIPNTGDGSGLVLPIVGGLLVLSVLLVVVYFVLSAKKKKK